MYESYWQLDSKPFEAGCDPAFFYAAETHQAALLKLRYAVENRRGGAVLTGGSGLGKTLLVQLLKSNAGEHTSPFVHLVFPRMQASELLAYLADEFDEAPLSHGTPGVHESLRRIQKFLEKNSDQGRHAVLVVDEAHLIDNAALLETLRLLLNIEFAGRPALTLLLTGQLPLLTAIERMPQFEERFDVKCLLHALGKAETAAYVDHRLRTSGAAKTVFSEEALDTVHELTGGVPRRINRLCDLALLIGYAEELDSITPAHLHSLQRELLAVACD